MRSDPIPKDVLTAIVAAVRRAELQPAQSAGSAVPGYHGLVRAGARNTQPRR
jgi:hypothetical protein